MPIFVKNKANTHTDHYRKQGSKFDQWAVPINRFLYSTTVQNFTHLSYSFRVTTPIIGAAVGTAQKNLQRKLRNYIK